MLRTFILFGCCCSFVYIAAQRRPQPGDYPALKSIPQTSFDCKKRPVGYYADPDPTTRCQVYHMCDMKGNKFSYLCPNGTLFHQQHLICAHWYQVNCTRTLDLYKVNKQMFPFEKFDTGIVNNNYSTEHVIRFSVAATQPPQQPNKPIVHEVKPKELNWQLQPGTGSREQNAVKGNTNLNIDVHIPISSARAILQSFEPQPNRPSPVMPPIIRNLFEQTTNVPRSPNFRGRTKFATSNSRAKPTSSIPLQHSREVLLTDPPGLPVITDKPQQGDNEAVFGSKMEINTDRPSVIRTSFVPPIQSRNKIRNRSKQQPSQLALAGYTTSLPNFSTPSRVASFKSSWEATLPLEAASSEREQFAFAIGDASLEQQSTATPQRAATTTPWISLRSNQWPNVRQGVYKGKIQTLSSDSQNQGLIAPTQAPFGEPQPAADNPEKKKPKVTKLTMTFPKGGFFKKYGILSLNEKCPLCNPYFLKNDQCFPCVTIR